MGSGGRSRWSPATAAMPSPSIAWTVRSAIASRRAGGLPAVFGDRAVSAARAAHRPALRVSGLHGSWLPRREGRRRRLRAGRHARPAPDLDRQAGRSGRLAMSQASRRRSRAKSTIGTPRVHHHASPKTAGIASPSSDADGLDVGRHGVSHPPDGRPSAGRPFAAAGRRSADHPARGSHRSKRAPTTTTASPASTWSTRSPAAKRRSCRSRRSAARTCRASARACSRRRISASSLATSITYYARARDVARAKPSTLSRERDLLPRGEAVQRGVSMAQSQAMAAATGTELEEPDRGAERDHQRDVEPRAALGRRPIRGRPQGHRRRAGRAEDARRAVGRRSAAATTHCRRRRSRSSDAGRSLRTSPVTQAIASMGRAVQQLDDQAHLGRHPARDGGAERAAESAKPRSGAGR